MRAIALLLALATPAIAANRVPVPKTARTVPALQAAAAKCAAMNRAVDACYDIQVALARALVAAARYPEAKQALETARASTRTLYEDIDDRYADITGRAEFQKVRPEQVDPNFPRIAALRKQFWIDAAETRLVEAEAAEAQGNLFEAAQAFDAYWSIHTSYVQNPATAERALAMGLRGVEIYLTAGAAESVENNLRYSLPKAEAAFGRDHPVIVALLIARARAQSAMGKYREAEAMFADARARAGHTSNVTLQADADAAWARHLLAVDRPREALDIQRTVVVRLESAKAPPARLAQAYRDFAEVSSGQEALDIAARAVDLHVAAYGAEHLLTARARIVAAGLLDREGRLDQAERERAAGIAILSKRLAVLSPEIAMAQLRQAENLIQKGRCDEVRSLSGSAMDSFIYFGGDGRTADSGKTHPNTARAQFLMGMCELRTNPASGIDRLQKAAAIQRVTLVATHPERIHTEMALGMVARAQGDFGSALRQFRTVASAAQERVRSYPDFNAAAQREQREYAPVYRAIIQTAWVASKRG